MLPDNDVDLQPIVVPPTKYSASAPCTPAKQDISKMDGHVSGPDLDFSDDGECKNASDYVVERFFCSIHIYFPCFLLFIFDDFLSNKFQFFHVILSRCCLIQKIFCTVHPHLLIWILLYRLNYQQNQ